ncbi:hypothetical protein KFL_003740105 [Klebsormidium nitens]|uniref:Uncharacterized protein n=1 Tax=Klebsormidium nitens TaxID=105231 RepID=A0A1Y1IA04_KLENI|nr:hypothetical protein KFL_003740105 [Klebsormidium nitens]|eukprot:GAQ87750.1 hypothetical protein KFL_003740105 [Klebsormidium nitens]
MGAEEKVAELERERNEANERFAELEGKRIRAEETIAEFERERTRTGEEMAELEKGQTKAERKIAKLERRLRKQSASLKKSEAERTNYLPSRIGSGNRKQGVSLSWKFSSDKWCFPKKRSCTKQTEPRKERRRP